MNPPEKVKYKNINITSTLSCISIDTVQCLHRIETLCKTVSIPYANTVRKAF